MKQELEPYRTALQNMRACERFKVSYTFIYPHDIFFTAQGRLSARAYDLSNTEKSIQDEIFKLIGTDDRFVVELHSFKKAGSKHCIEVEIEGL